MKEQKEKYSFTRESIDEIRCEVFAFSGILHRLVSWIMIDVSGDITASVIRINDTQKMKTSD
jgi:hypothetical protein